MDDLDKVGLSIGNDPGLLHKTNQIDLIAIFLTYLPCPTIFTL